MLAWTRHAISSSFLHSPTSLRNKPATPQRMMPASTPPRSCSCCPPCAAPRELLTGRPADNNLRRPPPRRNVHPPARFLSTTPTAALLAAPSGLDYSLPAWPRPLPLRLWPFALRPCSSRAQRRGPATPSLLVWLRPLPRRPTCGPAPTGSPATLKCACCPLRLHKCRPHPHTPHLMHASPRCTHQP